MRRVFVDGLLISVKWSTSRVDGAGMPRSFTCLHFSLLQQTAVSLDLPLLGNVANDDFLMPKMMSNDIYPNFMQTRPCFWGRISCMKRQNGISL